MNFKMSKYDIVIDIISLSLLLYIVVEYFSDNEELLKHETPKIIEKPIVIDKNITEVKIQKKEIAPITITKVLVKKEQKIIKLSKQELREQRLQNLRQKLGQGNGSCKNKSINEHYAYLNKMRVDSGMIPLKRNKILEKAANNHSKYLYENFDYIPHDLTMHNEDESLLFFTGFHAYDRAQSEGHFTNSVFEGIAFAHTAKESIDGLMTAIYHRFRILNFHIDEVGMSNYKIVDNCMFSFVHNPSISIGNDLCQEDFNDSIDDVLICKDDKKVSATLYLKSIDEITKRNPEYVLYPSNNANDIITKFYGELPDPIPDKDFTGNPSSIQFNPYYYKNKSIELISFTIHEKNKEKILDARVLTKETDPNKRFNRYQFALFPLDVLEYYSTYIVKFKYKLNGIEQPPITWKFTTGYKNDYRIRNT